MFGFDLEVAAADAPRDSKGTDQMQAAVFRNPLRVTGAKQWDLIVDSLAICELHASSP